MTGMTTAQDLAIVAAGPPADPTVEQGDLSIALAGAELLDLVDREAVSLDEDRIVPGPAAEDEDPLLREAASLLVRRTPYETVEDWLWRRGNGLAVRYRDALAAQGLTTPARAHRTPFRRPRAAPADSAALDRAARRWTSGEPVLAGLAGAARITDPADDTSVGLTDAQATVLGSVHQAITELAAERQRRSIEAAAFDNIWRGN